MGIRASLARLDALLTAATPKSFATYGFDVVDETAVAYEVDGAGGRFRQCAVVVLDAPADGGRAGSTDLLRRAACAVVVRYNNTIVTTRRDLDVTIGEDVNTIINTLQAGDPNTSLTGLDGVVFEEDPIREDAPAGDRQVPQASMLRVPFIMLYHEEV